MAIKLLRRRNNNNVDDKVSPSLPSDHTMTSSASILTTASSSPQHEHESPKQLKQMDQLCSGHVLINQERWARGLTPLKRARGLDDQARAHAERMAAAGQCFPSATSIEELREQLSDNKNNLIKVGQNVWQGSSVLELHQAAMHDATCAHNILSPTFCEFGLGTARGKCAKSGDTVLFVVQLFRGGAATEEETQ